MNLTSFLDLGANRSFILNSLLPWAWHPFLFSFQIFTLHLGLNPQRQPREKDLGAGGVFWRWSQEAQGRYRENQIECWSPKMIRGCPGGSDGEESACNAGDPGPVPGSRRSPGEGNGHPLQYSHLENPMDRGVWWATVHGVPKSCTRLN